MSVDHYINNTVDLYRLSEKYKKLVANDRFYDNAKRRYGQKQNRHYSDLLEKVYKKRHQYLLHEFPVVASQPFDKMVVNDIYYNTLIEKRNELITELKKYILSEIVDYTIIPYLEVIPEKPKVVIYPCETFSYFTKDRTPEKYIYMSKRQVCEQVILDDLSSLTPQNVRYLTNATFFPDN